MITCQSQETTGGGVATPRRWINVVTRWEGGVQTMRKAIVRVQCSSLALLADNQLIYQSRLGLSHYVNRANRRKEKSVLIAR